MSYSTFDSMLNWKRTYTTQGLDVISDRKLARNPVQAHERSSVPRRYQLHVCMVRPGYNTLSHNWPVKWSKWRYSNSDDDIHSTQSSHQAPNTIHQETWSNTFGIIHENIYQKESRTFMKISIERIRDHTWEYLSKGFENIHENIYRTDSRSYMRISIWD